MKLTDIEPEENWARLERELFDRFHINCTVYNADGIGVTGTPNWCNRLCPKIKGNPESLAAICAPGNQNFMAQARKTQKPVIGECDAGMVKIAVPICVNGEFLGTAGGCGLLPDSGDVETFLIEKTLGLSPTEITDLSKDLGRMSNAEAERMAAFIRKRLDRAIEAYQRQAAQTA